MLSVKGGRGGAEVRGEDDLRVREGHSRGGCRLARGRWLHHLHVSGIAGEAVCSTHDFVRGVVPVIGVRHSVEPQRTVLVIVRASPPDTPRRYSYSLKYSDCAGYRLLY